MKYYEMHDHAYSQLKKDGFISWDKEKDIQKILNHEINNKLEPYLQNYFPKPHAYKSLDIGTGAGNCALYLAKYGFTSKGYDISSEAISLARQNAKALKLEATFQAKDLCNSILDEKFNLIVDSSLLHCIVLKNDRKQVLSTIRNSLADNSYFFIHTMVSSSDMSLLSAPGHLELKGDILWSTGKDEWGMEWKFINGKKYFPHRRILKVDDIQNELHSNKFHILDEQITPGKKGLPDVYVAWGQKN